MWDSFASWLSKSHAGDIASLAGLVISLFGFALTLFGVRSAKKASEESQKAAEDAKGAIKTFDVVVDFSTAISILEEIKRAHRSKQWSVLPDRYSALRKILIILRTSGFPLDNGQQKRIQSALTNIASLEEIVERSLANGKELNVPKFNILLSINADELQATLVEIKNAQVGG